MRSTSTCSVILGMSAGLAFSSGTLGLKVNMQITQHMPVDISEDF